jgi:dTDP-glucose pyrophosphorylase
MTEWKSTLVSPDTPMIKTIEVITKSSLQVALVVDEDKRLLGTITDGDVRRAILHNFPMTTPVEKIMRKEFTVATAGDSREVIFSIMKQKGLRHIPVVDDKGRVIDLKLFSDMSEFESHGNIVVLMAGGLGTRLHPLTKESPKPLLEVAGKPLLEIIIKNFLEHGLYRFFIALNYKAAMIEDYFGDGSKWGAEITYLRETEQLGTAGALSLLPERPSMPVFVMNGDLLTKVNFKQLLHFHSTHGSSATMCVRQYDFQVPYGVVNAEGHHLVTLEEKPVHSFFVNAGIYVLEPDMLDLIPKNSFFNITTLFEKLLQLKKKITVFPILEYWLDIGRISDYERANGEYLKHFE